MIRFHSSLLSRCCLLMLCLNAVLIPAQAQEQRQSQNHSQQNAKRLSIGFVELEGDPRYSSDSLYTGIVFRTFGRPHPGAELGLEDARAVGQVMGIKFDLKRQTADTVNALARTVRLWAEEDEIRFVLADLPAQALIELADASANLPLLFFNVSAPDDALRGNSCRTNVVHTLPSNRMLTDALVQHLVARKWRDVLILAGNTEADKQLADAFRQSARKFGATIVDERRFVLENDPGHREQNNITLLTGDANYDVLFVVDTSGEFGRYLPYQIRLPHPVVGSAGLMPGAWHWAWHRHGAPQLQHRFEELAMPRRMNSEAWAAWVAVKALTQAALRAESNSFSAMRRFILSDRLNLDGAKGYPSSFRAWDQQLRQPVLLATSDAVIARAPLPEFLHEHNRLDTLGLDAPETNCRLRRDDFAQTKVR